MMWNVCMWADDDFVNRFGQMQSAFRCFFLFHFCVNRGGSFPIHGVYSLLDTHNNKICVAQFTFCQLQRTFFSSVIIFIRYERSFVECPKLRVTFAYECSVHSSFFPLVRINGSISLALTRVPFSIIVYCWVCFVFVNINFGHRWYFKKYFF